MTKKSRINNILLSIPIHAWLLVFTIVPLVMIFFYAFVEVTDEGLKFTISNIVNVLSNERYQSAFYDSLYYAFISTVVCFILGYPLAYVMTKLSNGARDLLMILLMLPMWMNILIRTYALKALIDEQSILSGFFKFVGLENGTLTNTTTAIIIGMVYNFLPFLVLPIYTSLLKIDYSLIEAARDLGASGVVVFSKILLPLSLPGILSGITMVFVPSVTTFVIPQLLANKKWTVGSLIEYKFMHEAGAGAGVSSDGSALSFLLMIIVIAMMSIVNLVDKENDAGGVV
ncbi:MAG TPA: ABC transporter permease [Clostridiaceae bacterium]|jgi:spermidine/putrescine transport system permease protein|nr:ABC transporter permease [Clostridiaceae bacterium]HOA30972.1 ABC transporter permease [Clostridia bacterium]